MFGNIPKVVHINLSPWSYILEDTYDTVSDQLSNYIGPFTLHISVSQCSGWVIDSYRFGDSYPISELCELVFVIFLDLSVKLFGFAGRPCQAELCRDCSLHRRRPVRHWLQSCLSPAAGANQLTSDLLQKGENLIFLKYYLGISNISSSTS